MVKKVIGDQSQAKGLQEVLWDNHIESLRRHWQAGWNDPYRECILERYEERCASDGVLPVNEPEPEPRGNGGNGELRPVYWLLDETPTVNGYRYKLGYGNAKERKRATTLPSLSIVYQEPGGREREKELHALFAADRIDRSEWFFLSPRSWAYLGKRGVDLSYLRDPRPAPTKKTGRPPDIPTAEDIAFCLQHPEASTRFFYKQKGWWSGKAKRYRAFAFEVSAAIA